MVERAASARVVSGRSSAASPPSSNRPKSGEYDDMRDLEQSLRIDENALEEALRDQPESFYRISKACALEISRRDAAKQALADAEAAAVLAVRDEARAEERRAALSARDGKDAGGSKIKLTEAEVAARVQLDAVVSKSRIELATRNESVAKLSALKEAFQQRSYALKDLASLYIANYYTASEHNAGRSMRDRHADEARRRMSEARRHT